MLISQLQTESYFSENLIIIPIAFGIILVLLLANIILNLILRRKVKKTLAEAGTLLTEKSDHQKKVSEQIKEVFAEAETKSLHEIGEALAKSSDTLYGGRWLADPDDVLLANANFNGRIEMIFSTVSVFLTALLALSVGALPVCLGAFASEFSGLRLMAMTLIPAWTLGAVFVLFLLLLQKTQKNFYAAARKKLCTEIAGFAPVYQDRSGVAMLMNELFKYSEDMREEVKSFSEIASNLVDVQFTEGIKSGIKDVMENEVAPTLKEANETLGSLAGKLTEKQEVGMSELANTFACNVASILQSHLSTLPEALNDLKRLVTETRNMMQAASDSIDSSVKQNGKLNEEIMEVLHLMAVARNDMANEVASLSDKLELMSQSSDKLSSLYAGEQATVANNIGRMSDQLKVNSEYLSSAINHVQEAMETTQRMADDRTKQYETMLQAFERQIAAEKDLSEKLMATSREFAERSTNYSRETLANYDQALAEVVERLTFSTSEIREAIDALPGAIRSAGK